MRKIAFVAAVAAAAVSAPAFAQGPYIGLGVTHENTATSGDLEGLLGVSGIGGTVLAGYSMPLSGSVFAGIEANFDLSSAKLGDNTAGFEADNSFGVSGRLGTNLNEKTSLFGRVGYQRGRLSFTADSVKESESFDGVRFGAGVQTAVSEKVSLRAEYSRTHYSLSKESRDDLAPEKGGYNTDQFSMAVVFGF